MIQVIPKTRYKYINPWNAPIPNDYLGIHFHRWPTNRVSINNEGGKGYTVLQQNPAITNYDWWRTTDGPFGYQWSIHFQVESLIRVGTTVTVRIYFPPEAGNNSNALENFTDGDKIVITGATESGFNGEFPITRVIGSKIDAYNNTTDFADLQYTSPESGNVTATTTTHLDCFNWTKADAAYNQVSIIDNKKILYTFLGVPNWMAKEPYGSRPYGGPMSASFPTAAMYPRYIEFCQALATRYPNITHFDVGNEPGTGAWEPFYNPTLVAGDPYSIKINSYGGFSGGFLNVKVGCSVQCAGISKLAKITAITRYPDGDDSQEAILTFDMQATGPVSGVLYSSFYYYRTVVSYTPRVGTTKATITLNDVSGLSATTDGTYHHINSVYGTNIKDYTYITAINGNTITIEGTYLGPISGQVRFSAFEGAFFTGSPNELAELTRITKLAIKAVRPNAKIVSAADSHVSIPGPETPNPTTASTGDGILNTFPLVPKLWEASAEGYSYLGDTGVGTRAIDHVDVLATHTYGAQEFEGFLQLKNYAASLGYPDIDIWSTEFGVAPLPYLGRSYQNYTAIGAVTHYSPSWIKSITTSNIVTLYGHKGEGVPAGKWLRDIGGNKIGIILSLTTVNDLLHTVTLKDNALKNYSGRGIVFTANEKREALLRSWIGPAVAGFKKAFIYNGDDGTTYGLLEDSYSSKLIGTLANSIKGKTVATVEQLKNNAPIKINFTDGTSLNTGDLLNKTSLRDQCTTQVLDSITGKNIYSTYNIYSKDAAKPQFNRDPNGILYNVDLTSISVPINYSFPDGTHTIRGLSGNGTSASITLTSATPALNDGMTYEKGTFVEITGCDIAGYNGTFKVTSNSWAAVTTVTNTTIGTPTTFGTIKQIAAINITGCNVNGTTVTVAYTNPLVTFITGDIVVLTGMVPYDYNGRYVVNSGTNGSFTITARAGAAAGASPWTISNITTFGKILSGAYGTRGCTAITPRHVISAAHYPPPNGAEVIFADRVIGDYTNNKLYKRTITNSTTIAGTDIWIGYLDSDLPASIMPMTVIASDYRTHLPSSNAAFPLLPVYYSFHYDATIHLGNLRYFVSTPQSAQINGFDVNDPMYSWFQFGGGSGSPCFSVINDIPSLLFIFAVGSGSGQSGYYGGPMAVGYIAEINTILTTLHGSNEFQLVTNDLSTFL